MSARAQACCSFFSFWHFPVNSEGQWAFSISKNIVLNQFQVLRN